MRGSCPANVSTPDAEHTALHAVIREHLENFLRAAADHGEGAGLPQFIERVKAACANARHPACPSW